MRPALRRKLDRFFSRRLPNAGVRRDEHGTGWNRGRASRHLPAGGISLAWVRCFGWDARTGPSAAMIRPEPGPDDRNQPHRRRDRSEPRPRGDPGGGPARGRRRPRRGPARHRRPDGARDRPEARRGRDPPGEPEPGHPRADVGRLASGRAAGGDVRRPLGRDHDAGRRRCRDLGLRGRRAAGGADQVDPRHRDPALQRLRAAPARALGGARRTRRPQADRARQGHPDEPEGPLRGRGLQAAAPQGHEREAQDRRHRPRHRHRPRTCSDEAPARLRPALRRRAPDRRARVRLRPRRGAGSRPDAPSRPGRPCATGWRSAISTAPTCWRRWRSPARSLCRGRPPT